MCTFGVFPLQSLANFHLLNAHWARERESFDDDDDDVGGGNRHESSYSCDPTREHAVCDYPQMDIYFFFVLEIIWPTKIGLAAASSEWMRTARLRMTACVYFLLLFIYSMLFMSFSGLVVADVEGFGTLAICIHTESGLLECRLVQKVHNRLVNTAHAHETHIYRRRR